MGLVYNTLYIAGYIIAKNKSDCDTEDGHFYYDKYGSFTENLMEVVCMFLEIPFVSGSFTVMLCVMRWPIIAAESHYVKSCKYQKH